MTSILEVKSGQIPWWIGIQTALPIKVHFNYPGFTYNDDLHIYKMDGVEWPSVTQLLKHNKMLSNFYTKDGASRGKYVHKLIELYDKATLDNYDWDKAYEPYLDEWKQFLEETGWFSTHIETPGFNREIRACCTLDRMGYFPGKQDEIKRYSLRLKGDGEFKKSRLKEIETNFQDDWADLEAMSRVYWKWRENTSEKERAKNCPACGN